MTLPRELYAGPQGQVYQRAVPEVTAAFTKTTFQLDQALNLTEEFVLPTPANYLLQCSVQLDPQATL